MAATVDVVSRIRTIVLKLPTNSLPLSFCLERADRFEDVAAERHTLLFLFSFSSPSIGFVDVAIVNVRISGIT